MPNATGYRLPDVKQLTNGKNTQGNIGGLWSEWGSSKFDNKMHWTSEAAGTGKHTVVAAGTGAPRAQKDTLAALAICYKAL